MVEIVAELSGNHNGSLERAKALIHKAKHCGASTIKLQTYRPETICATDHSLCSLDHGPWSGRTLRDLYAEAHTPREWHKELFDEATGLGMRVFSTPFCPDDVDFLESLGCERYKVSSFDVVNTPLLARIAKTKKPVVISTGLAGADEIDYALGFFPRHMVTLLHCISDYPARPQTMNMQRLDSLQDFNVDVGLSDHSLTDIAPILAVAMGAVLIEKHLCMDRSERGPDASFSLEPAEFWRMVRNIHAAELAMIPRDQSDRNKHLLPSLWLVRDVQPGEMLTNREVMVLRPSGGLPPCRYDDVIGRHAKHAYTANQPLTEGMLQ
jgi:pseudaminic acid synthase